MVTSSAAVMARAYVRSFGGLSALLRMTSAKCLRLNVLWGNRGGFDSVPSGTFPCTILYILWSDI